MSGTNHVAGGIVFTGIFASLWDINIFSNPAFLGITVVASLLPDIDHTKSPIGKAVYPLAKWLDKKYGHRTITHSLIFFFVAMASVAAIENIINNPTREATIVFSLALFSHLLFDMITIQGIPLFYPFYKNPCVLPASRESRLRSGNVRTEIIALSVFILLGVFCYPLMANGFWLTFNRSLGTTKQLASQFRKSDELLIVDYEVRRDFNRISGVGYCLSSSETNTVIYDTLNSRFMKISNQDVVKKIYPTKSDIYDLKQITKTIHLNNASLLDLKEATENQQIYRLNIYSDQPINLLIDKENKTSSHFSAENINEITVLETKEKNSSTAIQKLEIRELKNRIEKEENDYSTAQSKIKELRKKHHLASDYDKNKITEAIKELSKISEPKNRTNDLKKLQIKLKQMEAKAPEAKIYGAITIITI